MKKYLNSSLVIGMVLGVLVVPKVLRKANINL